MLRSIEAVNRQKITVSQLPTAVDVRARRLGLTEASLRESILAGDSEHYRVVVESLTDEHDLMTIAMAAVKLAHERGMGATPRDDADLDLPAEEPAPRAPKRERPPRTRGLARIYVGAGRKNNLRPTDLVGAIVNEAGIEAREIGPIEITDRFSLVELPEA